MKVSDSSTSTYWGKPLSVLRVMDGSASDQPKPNGPLPTPESYERDSWGPNPERPGLVAIGTVREPVPVTGFAANFSPIPRIAPPPFGREIGGRLGDLVLGSVDVCRTLSVIRTSRVPRATESGFR